MLFESLTTPFVVNIVSLAILLGIVFAHVLWLFERKVNRSQFPLHYLDGIDDAVWWAVGERRDRSNPRQCPSLLSFLTLDVTGLRR